MSPIADPPILQVRERDECSAPELYSVLEFGPIHPLRHPSIKYLLSVNYGSGTFLGTRDMTVSKTDPGLMGLTLVGKDRK